MSGPASRDYSGADLAAIDAARGAALRVFVDDGFAPVEPGALMIAEDLLDLYGEDVRARAFVFGGGAPEGAGAELCLRPDLTLPVVRAHLARRAEEGRYVAAGSVFRRPADGEQGAAEFLQVGCEWFGARDPALAEAKVFALAAQAIEAAGGPVPRVVTGDLSILFALIEGSDMPSRWRARLKRHVWRPRRFAELLQGFAGQSEADEGRIAFLKALGALEPAQARAAVERMLHLSDVTHVGLRTPDEIAQRFLDQAEDARAHPLSAELVEALTVATTLEAPCDVALARLRDLAQAVNVPMDAALDRMEARLTALDALGFAPADLPFDGEFGRNLEYYDGFVFEMYSDAIAQTEGRRSAQLAGGGRYDAMVPAAARAFGIADLPFRGAVGCAVRPETILEARA